MKLSISLPDHLVVEIDKARGDVPRSVFIRRRLEVDWVRSLRVSEAPPVEPDRSPEPRIEPEVPREASAAKEVGYGPVFGAKRPAFPKKR